MAGWPPEKMARWVTLYTDAGWKEGRAKCGFIARGSADPVWLKGSGMANCDSSNAAEMIAVLHGIRRVHAAFGPNIEGGLEGLFVRTDCLAIVEKLKGHRRRKKREYHLQRTDGDLRKALQSTYELITELNITLLVKHVRAHGRERDGVRRWMNRQADNLGNMRATRNRATEKRGSK